MKRQRQEEFERPRKHQHHQFAAAAPSDVNGGGGEKTSSSSSSSFSTDRNRGEKENKLKRGTIANNNNKNNIKKKEGEEEIILTPHTLRLLKLIKDGSYEHASRAAVQLTTITAGSAAAAAAAVASATTNSASSSSTSNSNSNHHHSAATAELVLWDVLGRLQGFLIDTNWQTRHNSSLAMQGVARHLPYQSRKQFLEQQQQHVTTTNPTTTTTTTKEETNDQHKTKTKNYLWLTLKDFHNELESIVQGGRLLWSHSESAEEKREEEILQQMDQQRLLLLAQRQQKQQRAEEEEDGTTTHDDGNENNNDDDNDDDDDFVSRRVQWQRRVLAQRIGLSGLIQATGDSCCLADTITSEDLTTSSSTRNISTRPTKRKRKNPQREHQSNKKDGSNQRSSSASMAKGIKTSTRTKKSSSPQQGTTTTTTATTTMRALLVMEMKREHNFDDSSYKNKNNNKNNVVSHDNPQTLLATELLYRVFDPIWYVRHGALMGLLALLRAWHQQNSHDPQQRQQQQYDNNSIIQFGAWPQDILVRCLCILVLDRFGDYSGTTVTIGALSTTRPNNNESDDALLGGTQSGSVVAPVRETAGQLLSMVWYYFAPSKIQEETLLLLYDLATTTTRGGLGKSQSVVEKSTDSNNNNNNNKSMGRKTRSRDDGGSKDGNDDDRSRDWEIRHGALIGLKYIVAVQVASSSFSSFVSSQQQPATSFGGRMKSITPTTTNSTNNNATIAAKIPQIAIHCLTDEADDVQSVAAQLLSTLLSSSSASSSSASSSKEGRRQQTSAGICWREKALRQVWTALKRTRSVSSSILDLMSLCSDLLQDNDDGNNGEGLKSIFCLTTNNNNDKDGEKKEKEGVGTDSQSVITGAGMLDVFREYLDHDLASVRLAALRSIANSLGPISSALETLEGNEGIADETLFRSIDEIQERIFLTFFQYGSSNSSNGERCTSLLESRRKGNNRPANQPDEPDQEMSAFIECRRLAWRNIIKISRQRTRHKGQRKAFLSLACNLIFKYFGVSSLEQNSRVADLHRVNDQGMECLMDAADALSDMFRISQNDISSSSILEFCIRLFQQSPWTRQCEAACFLLRALSMKTFGDNGPPNPTLLRVLNTCRQSIITVINLGNTETAPICLAVDQCKRTRDILHDPGVLLIRDRAFLTGVDLVRSTESFSRVEDAVVSVQEMWKQTLLAKGVSEDIFATKMNLVAATISSMRLFTIVAGTLLAGNQNSLPVKKATPIIRPIMTSLKNETNQPRRYQACEYMKELLTIMFAECGTAGRGGDCSPFLKPREKVLGTMCESISSSSDGEDAGEGSPPVERYSFARAIQSFIFSISKHMDSIEMLPAVWLRLKPLLDTPSTADCITMSRSLNLLEVVCEGLKEDSLLTSRTISDFLPTLVMIACRNDGQSIRLKSKKIVHLLCSEYTKVGLPVALPGIVQNLEDKVNDSFRLSACQLLLEIVQVVGLELCPFVRDLLRLVMSLMADPVTSCARIANAIFACLVRVAPLVSCESQTRTIATEDGRYDEGSVVDHLIHGRPLPPYSLPPLVQASLSKADITLRQYQLEGISWLRFLQGVNLNGALCDSMGLGKTLQALIGVAIAHVDGIGKSLSNEEPKSLVVCPASVVGHWEAEIKKFFPDHTVFRCMALIGNAKDRKSLWKESFAKSNIVVTSYSVLRTDVEVLSKPFWRFCILDEGHLIRNPKTATAKAARCIRSHHKLLLSGTPVQNKVQEIFAAFDFLMPNFLGSPASFTKEFAGPITKGHLPGATADKINDGIEKLKLLHQQVLPFILRREKEDVLKELPPKNVSTVPCQMSILQRKTYENFLATEEARKSIAELQRVLQEPSETSKDALNIGSDALKTLLFLRLLCTHPLLVEQNKAILDEGGTASAYNIDMSGKFLVLAELLRACGIHQDQVSGADNDASVLYCSPDDEDVAQRSDISNLFDPVDDPTLSCQNSMASTSKCLVFAQFTQSLDAVEELLVKRHMPSVRYLRLDGRVPVTGRSALVDAFNNDPSIKLMLLTTRVGGLGLNLTGADTVIFLENDFNPFADMQAADRAHRLGQAKTVNVYRLVTKDTIEEKIMAIQEKKIALSKAIVNTDNSTLFSMGTDRLLDIFTCRTDSQNNDGSKANQLGNDGEGYNLEALVEKFKDEYSSLSVKEFIQVLRN